MSNMVSRKALLSLLLLVGLFNCISLVSAQISPEYIKQSDANVRRIADNTNGASSINFEQLYQEGVVYKSLTDSNIIQNSNLCATLQKQHNLDEVLTTARDVYYFLRLKSLLPRCNIEYSQESAREVLQNELGSIQTAEKLFFVIALAAELSDANAMHQACPLNSLYLQNDGTSRKLVSDPESNKYYETGYILEAVELCVSNGITEAQAAGKLVDLPLESILLNLISIESYQSCILEGTETFELTTRIFRLFHTLPVKSLKSFAVFSEKHRNPLLSFIKQNANSVILSTAERYQVVRVYLDVENTDVVVIKKQSNYVLTDKSNIAQLRFENVLGEQSTKKNYTNSTLDLQGTVWRRGARVSVETLNATATSNESWPIAIHMKQVKEAGVFVLKVSQNRIDLTEERFTVKTTLRVRNIEFEIAQGKGKIPKKYTHAFNERSKKGLEKITANQNSFIFVQFSLEQSSSAAAAGEPFTPSQIAVHLRHPTLKGVTHMVTADYDEIQNRYLAILDFGDPNMILPYSAVYEADLIVADQRLVKPITITFAKVDATFKTARDGKNPPNDADYVAAKPIVNIIEESIKSPPLLFVLSFVVMLATCLVFFLQLVQRIQLNQLRFERIDASQKITVQAFFAAILIAIGLLVLFWVQINLLQTVTYICAGAIPFIFISNIALNNLASAQQQKKNKAENTK